METEKYLNVVFRQEMPMRKFLEKADEPTLAIRKVVNDMLRSPKVAFRSVDEMKFIRVLAINEKADKEPSRLELGQLKHLISTREVDRTREVMLPKGVRLENYLKNRVVVWSHSPYEPENIIGKNLWIKPDDEGILALTQFMMSAEKAAGIFRLYAGGWLKAWSIGFIPLQGRRATKDDVKAGLFEMPKDATFNEDDVYLHEKWELLEYSAVAVPACAGALSESDIRELGLCEDLQKDLGIEKIVKLSRSSYYDIGGAVHGDGKKQEGGAAPEAPTKAEGAAAGDGGEGDGAEAGDEAGVKGRPKLKTADLEGNPSPGDIREAISLALNPSLSYNDAAYRWVVEVYPDDYPSGHAICSNRKDECFQFDYTFANGEAVVGADFMPVETIWRKEPEGKGHESWRDSDGITWNSVVDGCPGYFKNSYISGEKITLDEVLKPYPNVHSCRLRNPDDFQADSFRSYSRDHEGKKYTVIAGRLKGETTMTEQAFRYAKDVWTVAEARKHCKAHSGIEFAPATESSASLDVDGIAEEVAVRLFAKIKLHELQLEMAAKEPFIRVVKDEPLDKPESSGILKVIVEPDKKPGDK